MSGHHSWLMYCDYPACDEMYVGTPGDSIGTVRRAMRAEGWLTNVQGGKRANDLCERHAAEYLAVAKKAPGSA